MQHPTTQLDLTAFPQALDTICVEGGTFMMGKDDELSHSPHSVKLTDFHICKYPVTQALWEAVMPADKPNPSFFRGPRRPVEQVNWHEVQEFIKILNKKTGHTYRLPTEAEWEYAARGGKLSQGFTYAGSDKLKEVAWFGQNSHGETKPVGLKRPNELGIYDMSGNVWEWCEDRWSGDYYQQCADLGTVENPPGPDTGSYRVLRGGCWLRAPQGCGSACRNYRVPEYRDDDFGFRLVLSPR